MRRGRWLAFLAFLAGAPVASPQGNPVGPEFLVNTYTTNGQRIPAVASDASGNFVVVWSSSAQDGSGEGIFGQRYATTGAPLGPEFRVSTYTTSNQSYPSVSSDASGNFVVVWASYEQDGSDWGVFGQRYAASGAPLGPEFRVNTYTSAGQTQAVVASDSAGNFVVVWTSTGQDGSFGGVFGQRYAGTGAPLGSEFRVNTYTTSAQGSPAVASGGSGDFVVVWTSDDGSIVGVFGQRYASSGATSGPEFRVNSYTTDFEFQPAVASDAAGNFVVVWLSYTLGGAHEGIFGQRFGVAGSPQGPEFRLSTYTNPAAQTLPAVAADGAGNFVAVWNNFLQDGSDDGVFGQRYASSGAPLGSEFRVNTYTSYFQTQAAVASDPAGNFVVVWYSYQDGSTNGIYGQRYRPIVPVDLTQFTIE